MGSDGWLCHKHDGDLLEICEAQDVVQLSPDGDSEIVEVDPSKVYVIGGLVDHCAKKGLSQVSAHRPVDMRVLLRTPGCLPHC